jgi:hypothetical protein
MAEFNFNSAIGPSTPPYGRVVQPIVEKSIKEAQDFGTTFRRIDDYFHPAPPPDIPIEIFEIILGNSCRI